MMTKDMGKRWRLFWFRRGSGAVHEEITNGCMARAIRILRGHVRKLSPSVGYILDDTASNDTPVYKCRCLQDGIVRGTYATKQGPTQ